MDEENGKDTAWDDVDEEVEAMSAGKQANESGQPWMINPKRLIP